MKEGSLRSHSWFLDKVLNQPTVVHMVFIYIRETVITQRKIYIKTVCASLGWFKALPSDYGCECGHLSFMYTGWDRVSAKEPQKWPLAQWPFSSSVGTGLSGGVTQRTCCHKGLPSRPFTHQLLRTPPPSVHNCLCSCHMYGILVLHLPHSCPLTSFLLPSILQNIKVKRDRECHHWEYCWWKYK